MLVMSARTRFKAGLVLLNIGLLITAWSTWCAETTYAYSGTAGWDYFWSGVAAKHDLGAFALTAWVALRPLWSMGQSSVEPAVIMRRAASS